jgi:DNA-binding beta-propeller fold protein YncE
MRSSGFLGRAAAAAVAGALIVSPSTSALAQTLIIGNDEKQGVDQNAKPIVNEPGHDTLSVIDLSKPEAPRIAATIPLINSVVGPPTNLAIHPSGAFAFVANSLEPIAQGWAHRLEPDNEVFVIDLKATPPKVMGTITVGKQPSGMAISPKGDLALVVNRADGTISVLSIRGTDVLVTDTVTVGTPTDSVSAVAITPDGKHALATKAAANKVALLSIDDGKVTYDKRDLPAGIFPYNIAVTPDGKLALTADNGNGGSSDGNVDTVSVIDLEADPPRVIDHVTVGDSPEGLAISPKGDLAVTVEARGSNMPKSSFFYHPGGAVTALKIDGKKLTNVGAVDVGVLPEAVAFSPDGQYLYVGNFLEGDMSVIKVDGTTLTETGQRIKLPGHPASMRAGPQ